MSDQEKAVKNLLDMIRDSRTHETAVINRTKGSSASAGGIERANHEVEKQIRTLRLRFEENYGGDCGIGPQDVAISGTALCMADNALSDAVRWEDRL